jgi:hypothetical protein
VTNSLIVAGVGTMEPVIEPSRHIEPTTTCATSVTVLGSRSQRAAPPMPAISAPMKNSGIVTSAVLSVKVRHESRVNHVVAAAVAARPMVYASGARWRLVGLLLGVVIRAVFMRGPRGVVRRSEAEEKKTVGCS